MSMKRRGLRKSRHIQDSMCKEVLGVRRWSVPQIAELFRVRQQRVMAVIALKEMEIGARERGEELQEDLHEDMEIVFECHEVRGKFERHVRLLPTKPAFEVRHCHSSCA